MFSQQSPTKLTNEYERLNRNGASSFYMVFRKFKDLNTDKMCLDLFAKSRSKNIHIPRSLAKPKEKDVTVML